MKKVFGYLLTAVLLASVVGVAGATIYPPGPSGTCPDTMTIINLEDPAQTCHPASGDTVFGIHGVITGIDSIPGAYGFWMQLAAGGPYSGLDVFTGATNYQTSQPGTPTGGNLFYGDEVAVDGRSLEFSGLTELTDFDNIQSSNDIIIRKISTHGNPVVFPPYHVGTVNELDWVTGWVSANGTANQEPWEGCLVKVRGPLVVGRNAGPGVGTDAMLLCASGGLDTLCVDSYNLTRIPPLSVGTVVDSVQGILTQGIISSVPSYRIQIRGTYDLFAAAPPNVTDAFIISENHVRVVFDRPVTAGTAQVTSNYVLGSFNTVSSAVLQPDGKTVELTITQDQVTLTHLDQETVTVSGVVSTSGVLMTPGQSRSFWWGLMSIAEIQAPKASGLSGNPCRDYSNYSGTAGIAGIRVSYTGVAVARFGPLYYLADVGGGLRSGLAVYSPPTSLTIGEKYVLAGAIQEFDGISTSVTAGLTEGVNTSFIADVGPGSVPPAVVQTVHVLTDSTCDALQNQTNAEDYEEILVTVKGARIVENRTQGQSFLIAGPNPSFTDTMLVSPDINAPLTFTPDSAHTATVTGLLNWRNGNLAWRLTPRGDADIIDYGLNKLVGVDPIEGARSLSLAVSPNPSHLARVSFTVPKSGDVDLGVFDITGRRLVTLLKGNVIAGDYSKVWNGFDAAGNKVRSGVYFYRLKVGEQLVSTQAIKLD